MKNNFEDSESKPGLSGLRESRLETIVSRLSGKTSGLAGIQAQLGNSIGLGFINLSSDKVDDKKTCMGMEQFIKLLEQEIGDYFVLCDPSSKEFSAIYRRFYKEKIKDIYNPYITEENIRTFFLNIRGMSQIFEGRERIISSLKRLRWGREKYQHNRENLEKIAVDFKRRHSLESRDLIINNEYKEQRDSTILFYLKQVVFSLWKKITFPVFLEKIVALLFK